MTQHCKLDMDDDKVAQLFQCTFGKEPTGKVQERHGDISILQVNIFLLFVFIIFICIVPRKMM